MHVKLSGKKLSVEKYIDLGRSTSIYRGAIWNPVNGYNYVNKTRNSEKKEIVAALGTVCITSSEAKYHKSIKGGMH